jgi:AcrR family transcriptional regulator
MSEIANEVGIGRATLYKYFSDVDAILAAWHERQVNAHVAELAQVRDRAAEPHERLQGVLEAYALMSQGGHGPHGEAAATAQLQARLHAQLHEGAHVVDARRQLRELFRELLDEAAQAGEIRDDVTSEELADYCLHALAAAGTLTSKDAVRRLVAVTLSGLRPPP